jgi:hypothetical protein
MGGAVTTAELLAREREIAETLVLEARLQTVDGKGVGRWRVYYRGEGMRDMRWAAKNLVASAQVRVRKPGRKVVVVAGPMRADALVAMEPGWTHPALLDRKEAV